MDRSWHFCIHCNALYHHRNTSFILNITFIFVRCHHSWAVVTPVNYEHDSKHLTGACRKLKKKSIEEINEQSFSTSHPRSALSTQRVLDHTVLQIWLHIGSGMECYFWLNQHIEAKTKWPPFLRRYFKYIFLNENIWILIDISLKFIPKGRIKNIPALVQIMAWRQLGDNDGKFTDAYMRHSASMS